MHALPASPRLIPPLTHFASSPPTAVGEEATPEYLDLPGPAELLKPHDIGRILAVLNLDMSKFDCTDMVAFFDEGQKGALTFDEFCRMSQVVGLHTVL